MFLCEPEHTAYDLRWRMFGTDIRVHPWFWIATLILAWPDPSEPHAVRNLLIWIACVFVTFLVHEFGHVFMGRRFGTDGYIVLYSFGGLAVGANDVHKRWQRILISSAGPLADFLLCVPMIAGLLLSATVPLSLLAFPGELSLWSRLQVLIALSGLSDAAQTACSDLLWINLVWGFVNLLPVWPLDGGQISREACTWISPPNGRRASLGISVFTAGLFAVQSLAEHLGQTFVPFLPGGGLFSAIFFGALAYGSYQEMQRLPQTHRPWDSPQDEAWARPADWWKRGR